MSDFGVSPLESKRKSFIQLYKHKSLPEEAEIPDSGLAVASVDQNAMLPKDILCFD